MKRNILIGRPLSKSESDEIERMTHSGAKVYTISDGNYQGGFERISVSHEEKKEINYSVLSEVLKFGDLTVGDQTVSDLLRFGKASVWHYHKFRIYFLVRNLMYFLHPVQKRFNSFDDHIWFISPEVAPLKNLFPEVEFRVSKVKREKGSNIFKILFFYTLLAYRVASQFFKKETNQEYLVYLIENYINILDRKTMNPRLGNNLLEYLIDRLDSRFALLTEVPMPKMNGKSTFRFLRNQFESKYEGLPKAFAEEIFFKGFVSNRVYISTRSANKSIISALKKIEGIDMSPVQRITLEILKSFGISSFYFLFRYFSACKYFEKSQVKTVIAGDENSPMAKTILDAARFSGIKVVGIQHGAIHDLHPAFLFTANDQKNHVMADLTLIWGKYWEHFLVEKGNYPRESLIKVGQIRTDIIPALVKANKEKKAQATEKIVFASQPQRDIELRKQAAIDVFKAIKNMPKAELIVKLHPHELDGLEYYSEIAKQVGCINYVIDKTSDLYQLIASSDTLITCFSTVGTETVYFYKPLVILDHLNQDIQGYVSEGVAFHATNSVMLESILTGIFRGNLKIDHKKYDAFIEKYAYRIDGKVAERCINAITHQS